MGEGGMTSLEHYVNAILINNDVKHHLSIVVFHLADGGWRMKEYVKKEKSL